MDLPSAILLFFLLFGGSLGLLLNGGLLFTNLAKRNFNHPKYCLFIYCLLFSNFLYTVVEVTLQPWLIISRRVSQDQIMCKFAGFLFFCGGVSSVFYQTLLSLNRYFLLCREDLNEKFFCRKYTPFYIFGAVLLTVALNSAFIFFDEYGPYDSLCLVKIKTTPTWHLLLFTVTPLYICYGINIICAVKVSRFIKSCTDVTSRLVKRRIEEGRSIIKMIVLEMAIPILLEAPAITSFGLNRFTTGLPEWATALCCGLFIFHATTDPISMIYVIKPYRKAFLKWLGRMTGKTLVSSTTGLTMTTKHRSKYTSKQASF